jgi:hypothetical protein
MRVLMILALVLGMSAALIEAARAPNAGARDSGISNSYDITIGMGSFEPNPEAIAGGYFVLNDTTLVAVKPGSVSHDRLKNLTYEGRKGTLVFRVEP